MPISIKIKMKDGTVRDFPHTERAGGSWTKSVRYEGGFVIVKNECGNETAFPAADVSEVNKTEHSY